MECPVCGSNLSSHNIAAEWECDHVERWVDYCYTCGWQDDDGNEEVYTLDENGTRYDENGEPVGGLTPLAGDGGGLWVCPKCSHENDAMAIKCFFCDAAAPKA